MVVVLLASAVAAGDGVLSGGLAVELDVLPVEEVQLPDLVSIVRIPWLDLKT